MNDLLTWSKNYSPLVLLLLAFGAALLFVVRLIVEKGIASQFDARSKTFETLMKRRSAFEEKVLAERFALVTGLSARLERILTNLNRRRSGHPLPEGFLQNGEIVPLTEVFEEIAIHRLLLGEEFHALFLKHASHALAIANSSTDEAWQQRGHEREVLLDELRLAAEAAFGISQIRWY